MDKRAEFWLGFGLTLVVFLAVFGCGAITVSVVYQGQIAAFRTASETAPPVGVPETSAIAAREARHDNTRIQDPGVAMAAAPTVYPTATALKPVPTAETKPGLGEAGSVKTPEPTSTPNPTQAPALKPEASPTPSPTRPLSETDPIVGIKITGQRTTVTAKVVRVKAYCFLPNDVKYVVPGETEPRAGLECPNGVRGQFRYEVPFSTKEQNFVGWEEGYPGESPVILNGHKDGRGGSVFGTLQLLQVGDRLEVTRLSGKKMVYEMTGWEILDPDPDGLFRISPAKFPPGVEVITYTCGGRLEKGEYVQRRIVYWKLLP